ncbi:hypothetical protein [Polaromonas sp. C04]|nr:hypothetical protein [Polaromonas sp. C04]
MPMHIRHPWLIAILTVLLACGACARELSSKAQTRCGWGVTPTPGYPS